MRLAHHTRAALILAVFSATNCAALTITEVRFFKSADKSASSRITGQECSRERITRLYARFVLIGNQADLDYLREHDHLPVEVEWKRDGVVREVKNIGISQEKWEMAEKDFTDQLELKGYFEFPTTTYKTHVPLGTYVLMIRDHAQNILSPSGTGLYQPTLRIIPP